MRAQSIYLCAWSLYLRVRCTRWITMWPRKWKLNLQYRIFFICTQYLPCIVSFYMGAWYWYDLYPNGNDFYTSRRDVYTCRHDLYTCGNKQYTRVYLWEISICQLFTHRSEFLTCKNKFLLWPKSLPVGQIFSLCPQFFTAVIDVCPALIWKWSQIIWLQ